jgi:hypothetical protein
MYSIPHVSMPGSGSQQQQQPLHNSSIEQSLQFLVANSHATNAKLDEALSELKDMKTRVVQAESDIKHAFAEIFELKEKLNAFEQRDRATAIRIFGLPLAEEEKEGIDTQRATAKIAYEKIIRPILSAAKDKGLISTLPNVNNAIQEAFRLTSKKSSVSSTSTSRPPPILVKLTSRSIKTAIFKSKNSALPEPTEAEKKAGINRYHVAEDLTTPTFNLLMDLRAHEKVERAWTTEGQVRFTFKNDKTSYVHKVKSVFDSIESIIA